MDGYALSLPPSHFQSALFTSASVLEISLILALYVNVCLPFFIEATVYFAIFSEIDGVTFSLSK